MKISTLQQKVDQTKYAENYERIFHKKCCRHRTEQGCEIVDICDNEEPQQTEEKL
jgi:hypothetical protein